MAAASQCLDASSTPAGERVTMGSAAETSARAAPLLAPACRYGHMAVPRAGEVDPLRRRFPHFPPPLMEMLEACLQVRGWGAGLGCPAEAC